MRFDARASDKGNGVFASATGRERAILLFNMDITTIAAMLGLTKEAISAINQARDLAPKGPTPELQERLAHALTALNQLLAQHGELSIEHVKAKEKIETLERELRQVQEMTFVTVSIGDRVGTNRWMAHSRRTTGSRPQSGQVEVQRGVDETFVFDQYQKGQWRIPY